MLGWEPTERHEHFDAEGNTTGWTIVTREPEWDDFERDRLLALDVYDRGVCACGYHESITNDRGNFFTFDEKVCPVCKASAQYSRMQDASDERATGDNLPPNAPLPGDGRHTFIRQMAPNEVEERRSRQGPRRG